MAELLIAYYPPEPAYKSNDRRYQTGDIIEVYDDGRCKEPPSKKGMSIIVKIPGISKSEVERLMEPSYVDTGIVSPDGLRIERMDKRRRFFLRISDLPEKTRAILETERTITVQAKDIEYFIRDKLTGADNIWR